VPTAGDIVTTALFKSGIVATGQSVEGTVYQSALNDLADILAQWSEQRWLVWHLVTLSLTSTGANPYTVGPGGNFNLSARPAKIEAAYARQPNNLTGLPVDYPLEILPAREQYNRIAVKSLGAFPKYVFYEADYPLGSLYTYPVIPANIYQLFVSFKDVYPTAIAANTDLSAIPAIAYPAMKFVLAKWLRQAYGKGMKPDTELNNMARESLEIMRNAHAAIPELLMPTAIVRRSGLYNIFSDSFY